MLLALLSATTHAIRDTLDDENTQEHGISEGLIHRATAEAGQFDMDETSEAEFKVVAEDAVESHSTASSRLTSDSSSLASQEASVAALNSSDDQEPNGLTNQLPQEDIQLKLSGEHEKACAEAKDSQRWGGKKDSVTFGKDVEKQLDGIRKQTSKSCSNHEQLVKKGMKALDKIAKYHNSIIDAMKSWNETSANLAKAKATIHETSQKLSKAGFALNSF